MDYPLSVGRLIDRRNAKKAGFRRSGPGNLPKDKRMANVINRRVGCWIHYQLRLNGLTQKSVADEAGRSEDIVSHFLCGRKDSERVRTALCKVLGYESFEKLVAGMPKAGKGGVA
jgi:hypothetical protein